MQTSSLLVIVGLALPVALSSPAACFNCGPNETLRWGNRCAESCVSARCHLPCTLEAEQGCFCNEGYFRNADTKKCVKLQECPVVPCPKPQP